MEKNNEKYLYVSVCTFTAFILWTAAVIFIDVQPAGPVQSEVGLASFNCFFHRITGVHMWIYNITDWLSLIPIGFIAGFALLGVIQWIKRKNLLNVDYSIFVLGGFYIAVMAAYILFEIFAVNYRPVLINGQLEVSYPSSTTMLVLCVMPTAAMQLKERIKHNVLRRYIIFFIHIFTVFMVTGRLISGVHWISDIIGGILLSCSLVMMYCYMTRLKK